MLAKRRAGDDEEAVFSKSSDREITFDAAAFVETLSVCDRANRLVHFICANVVEETQCARSSHFKFIERCFVKKACIFAGHQMLIPDGARPIMTRPAFWLVAVSGEFFILFIPVWAFPSHLLAEVTPKVAQAVISGGGAYITLGQAFLTGEVNVVVLGIGFKGACNCIIEAVVIGAKTAHIQPPHIPFGVSIHDPFRHHLANAACACQAVCTECTRHPETLDGCWAKQEFTVWCKAFGTIQ